MPVTSKDTWNIQNDLTVINATVSESVTAATGTISTLAATTATIPTLNGGVPMVVGGGAINAGNSSSYPTISVAANGAVTIGTQNVASGGSTQIVDSVTNTSITYAAAANSVKLAYDTAIAANSYAASIAATAFSNAALRADAAYSNAIAYSGNAALAYANAITFAANATNLGNGTVPEARLTQANATTNGIMRVLDSVVNTSILIAAAANSVKFAYDTAIAANSYAASIAATAYSNAISYSGNAALAYANAISYVDTNAAFRLVAQTISAVWTHSANLNPSTNAINFGNTTARWNLYGTQADFSANVYIAGNLNVVGNLTVSGTTTTFDTTQLTVDDPIITLGGDTAPVADDNKDRGIEFRWHNGSTAKVGFFGYDDSTSEFTFIPDATNTSEVFSGTAGNVNFTKGTFTTLIGSIDASNVTSGTLPEARLMLANATTNGIMRVLDSVVNTNILIAAAANSVKLAYDTAVAANSYAATIAGTSYANAVAYTNTNAAFRGVAQTISGAWTFSTGPIPSANTIDLGSALGRWVVYANTINATGLITGSDGATITGQANASTGFGSGTINATSNGFFANATTISLGNSSVNVAITTAGITSSGGTGINPVSNSLGTALGTSTQRWIINANTVSTSGLATLATANITGVAELRGVTTLFANIVATTNAAAVQVGNSIGRVIIFANTINASGLSTLSTANVTSTFEGRGISSFFANVIISPATGTTVNLFMRGISNTIVNNQKLISFQGGAAGSTTRWVVGTAAALESGSNAGSNLVFNRHDDAGTFVDQTVVNRSTGGWSFANGIFLTAGSLLPSANSQDAGATTARWRIFANSINASNSMFYGTIPLSTIANTVGLAHIIPEAQNGAYSILLDDFNQMKRFVTGAAASWTISNNSTTAYPLGFTFIARNVQANTLTVARGSGVTIRKAGSTTNTDVTIAQWGYVSFTQEDTDVWVASGTY